MPLDLSRVPVLIGAGQVTNREEDPLRAPDPFELMHQAARLATASFGEGVLRALTNVWMVHSLSLRHADPASRLAGSLGAASAETRCSGMGG
ncbi:MAG TPA: hypothetical protein VEJ87_00065, partial [Acidimicrobiales bacterium]|nr:hypothetical protein [Acidimicrobiales bacterium]